MRLRALGPDTRGGSEEIGSHGSIDPLHSGGTSLRDFSYEMLVEACFLGVQQVYSPFSLWEAEILLRNFNTLFNQPGHHIWGAYLIKQPALHRARLDSSRVEPFGLTCSTACRGFLRLQMTGLDRPPALALEFAVALFLVR
jgi:hypothetical protein